MQSGFSSSLTANLGYSLGVMQWVETICFLEFSPINLEVIGI